MDEAVERDLLARCRRGDEGAFRQLVDGYKDLVFAILVRLISDRAHAEDLAQEVFLRVYRGLPYFRGEARLSTWIYRIAFNVCQQARDRPNPLVSLGHASSGTLVEPGVRDTAFDELELRDRLDKAIASLPPKERFLVSAHYLDGVKYEDLAAALDLPLGTVKTHLYRAKRRLRELLER
jgi:RNA polymerase sigma-70 factor (ECF subfamily)